MNDDLGRIELALQHLESEVVACLRERQRQAPGDGALRVNVPEAARSGFLASLDKLEAGLYSTGNTRSLRIVSEQHDAVRIRMLYIRHLLARDIPRAYVDEALQEFSMGTQPRPQPVASVPEPMAPAPRDAWWRALLSALAGMFSGGRARRPMPVATPRPAVAPRPVAPDAKLSDEEQMRLIYLHKLMEEDRLKLLSPEERPAPVSGDVRLPGYIARFRAKDFAEAHFAVRPSAPAGERIARTPEELRAKLAQRDRQKDDPSS